jgi:glycosyltransferase involved in cell wall biosynthesis
MNNNPLISVITVVYNGVATLEQTILSVINQTYKNIEYIIIDGGSTDGTVDVIKKYENHLAYWVSELDKGIYDAMNKGIDKATGEWINFMNSGDWFYNSDVILSIFDNNNVTNYELIYGNTEKRYLNKIKIDNPGKFWKLGIVHQSIFSKTFLNKKYKFDTNYAVAADFDFIYKIFLKGYKTYYMNITIVSFNMAGMSHYNRYLGFKEDRNISLKYRGNIFFKLKVYFYFLLCITIRGRVVDALKRYSPSVYKYLKRLKN